MLLTIDIGNTSIKFGGFDGNNLVFLSKLTTVRLKSSDEYASLFLSTCKLYEIDLRKIGSAIILSVVPTLTHTIEKALSTLKIDSLTVGAGVKSGLNIRTESPARLGTDLVCNAVGAIEKFGAPLVIVDFGTATTISYINEERQLCGCSISAGLKLSADALSKNCALLSDVTLKKPERLIGKNSTDSINSGVVLGSAFMVDGFVERIKNDYNLEQIKVVACGGFSKLVAPLCKAEIEIVENLSLFGLKKIYALNKHI